MVKHDDILSLTNADGSTETVNAGETLHRGVETALGAEVARNVRLDGSDSRSAHRYEEWRPHAGLEYGGNGIEDAPRDLASVMGSWSPALLGGGALSLEWQHVGPYWMDAENTHRYDGHDLLHLRASVHVRDRFVLFGRMTNVADTRYAEGAAFTSARGEEFAPGMPRALYLGMELR